MEQQLLLSLCIPTYGVVEWVIPVVESIYAQGCDNRLFEVVITDNGKDSKLGEALKKFDAPNLHYYQTTSKGFTNQIDAFRKCRGLFCKMLNHRSKLREGVLQKMIDLVDRYKKDKPIIYFADDTVKLPEITECKDMDEFCSDMSYFTSWSGGTGAWREDVDHLDESKINKMFPHMVFLFDLRQQSRYVIWNEKFDIMASDKGKGGYDLVHTFGVVYLDEVHRLVEEGRISKQTFNKVRLDLLGFLAEWYRNEYLAPYTIHHFQFEHVHRNMRKYYSEKEYLLFLLKAWHYVPGMYRRFGRQLHRNFIGLFFDRFVRGKIIYDLK